MGPAFKSPMSEKCQWAGIVPFSFCLVTANQCTANYVVLPLFFFAGQLEGEEGQRAASQKHSLNFEKQRKKTQTRQRTCHGKGEQAYGWQTGRAHWQLGSLASEVSGWAWRQLCRLEFQSKMETVSLSGPPDHNQTSVSYHIGTFQRMDPLIWLLKEGKNLLPIQVWQKRHFIQFTVSIMPFINFAFINPSGYSFCLFNMQNNTQF